MARKMDTKLMKIADEFADFGLLKPKDRSSTHFQTQETNSMFILTTQLKGYRRTNIKVESNEDERIVTISGEKPFQDKLVIGGEVVKKDIEMRGFRKSFKVPQGVVLDKINARYNEHDSELIIQMPKATKGVMVVGVEELKTEDVQTKSTKLVQIYTDGELSKQEIQEMEKDNVQNLGTNLEGKLEDHKPRSENKLQSNGSQEDEISSDNNENDSKEQKSAQRRFKICTPVIFGSAFFMSLIVLVFHLVQSEKPAKQQKKQDQD